MFAITWLIALVVAVTGVATVPQDVAQGAGTPRGFPSSHSGYHDYAEMTAEVLAVQDAHPDLVRRFSIGTSHEGRQLWAARITRNVSAEHADRPAILFDSLHHGREHLTTEMTLSILHLLVDHHDALTPLGARIRAILKSTVVYLVFMVNPDGGEYDLSDDGSGGCPVTGFRCWRKNRQPNAGSTAVGTDINRNYGYRWGCCGGSSGTPSSDTFRGARPFSTPEADALRRFVDGQRVNGVDRIKAHITFHTTGEKILWPYGYTRTDRPSDMTVDDHDTFVAMGRAMAALNGYTPEQSSDLYVTDGDQIDWMYGEHRAFSYTFEMYPGGGTTLARFYPDDALIARETQRNHGAVLYLMERAACPQGVLGAGRSAVHCGPFSDDFEVYRGSDTDPDGTDTATDGAWERGVVQRVVHDGGTKQPLGAASGRSAFVTGRLAGSTAFEGDLDGRSTVLMRPFRLTAGVTYRVGFRGYLAHDATSDAGDGLRVSLVPASGPAAPLFALSGSASSVNAAWTSRSATFSVPLTGEYRLRLTAVDRAPASLVEAGVDDLYVTPD